MSDVRKEFLSRKLKSLLGQVVTDVNFDEVTEKFVDGGGFDDNLPLEKNVQSAIQFAAIGKANEKF